MVLATADPEPWSAPVYYVYQRRRFYFLSTADSRHVTAALASRSCAASIFRDGDDYHEIEGLQMEGCLDTIPWGTEAAGVLNRYVRKFPTVQQFFVETVIDFRRFTERFRTQLYAFVPRTAFYLNNQAGLSRRSEIQLPD